VSGLNAGGSYRPLIVEMALSTPNFLTCSLWAVNTVIAEDRLLLWRSRTRPTRATSGMGASTHRVDPRRDRSNGRKNEPARGREHASPAWPSFASFADRCTSVSDNPSQIKSTFRMSRIAAAGSHARACPRRVCWPLCAWTIRATIRGARPYGLRCLHWDPRRNAHGVCQMLYRHGWSVTL